MAVSLQPIGSAGFYNADAFASALGVGRGNGLGNPAAYGSIPATVSPQRAQSSSIGGNLSNVGSIYSLATGIGGASGAGGAANLNAALPGGTDALKNELALGNSNLAGNIDEGTLRNLEQIAAERGVATGSIGSPNSTAALMQALGRTTQQTEALGGQQISSAVGQAPMGPQFNPQGQLLTPAEQLEQENYNSQLRSAPDPSAAAAADLAALGIGRGIGAGSGGFSLPSAPSGSTAPTSPWGNFGTFSGYGSGINPGWNQGGSNMSDIPGGVDSNGLIDNGDGTKTDPNTGLLIDANTGEIISDAGGGQYGAGGEGYTPVPNDQGEYGYFEG